MYFRYLLVWFSHILVIVIDDGGKLEEEIGVGSYLRKLPEYLKEKYLREKLESVSI